jgi:hypothetical protein
VLWDRVRHTNNATEVKWWQVTQKKENQGMTFLYMVYLDLLLI